MAKHVPMRTCIATGVKKPKSEMVRIVSVDSPETESSPRVIIDPTGKFSGRGANLDSDLSALEIAFKKSAIERALKLEGRLKDSEKEYLRSEMGKLLEERQFRAGKRNVTLKISKAEFEAKLR